MKQSVYITPLSITTLTLRHSKPSYFSYLRYFSLQEVLHFRLPWHLIPPFMGASDMSQICLQGYKPKTGPKRTQKEYILKQRKNKYFTSIKLWSPKFKELFLQEKLFLSQRAFNTKTFNHNYIFTELLNKFLYYKTSQIVKHDCTTIIMKNSW
jgi:hypothetical protein